MNNLHAEVKNIKKILSLDLEIPFYQRPYRWTIKNVASLLEDIYYTFFPMDLGKLDMVVYLLLIRRLILLG